MTAVALMAQATERIEIGTAVVPVQTRHPVELVQQALSTQLVAGGRFTLGLGPSHHWIIDDMAGLPYERPAALRPPLGVYRASGGHHGCHRSDLLLAPSALRHRGNSRGILHGSS